MSSEAASEVKRALVDPRQLAAALAIDKGSKRQTLGLLVRCPSHAENTPSCSVTTGEDGTIRVRCFGCDFTGDALTLIAVVHGLSLRSQFREVLTLGAELAGLHALADELRSGRDGTAAPRQPQPVAPARPERGYPPVGEIDALWGACESVATHADASFELVRRRLDPGAVAGLDVARAVPAGIELPGWARYSGRSWFETGHRMILPVYDAAGERQSVRAYRVLGEGKDPPKRLPPAGYKAVGLVLANRAAQLVLAGTVRLFRFVVVEGEPDFLVHAVRSPDLPVFGLFSGSWHDGFANRIPYGSELVIRTHHDAPGEKYSAQVVASVRGRAVIRRSAA